jgi:hypothetical protein
MTDKELATKWVNSLCDNGFKNGWFGDKSEQYRKEEIGVYVSVMKGETEISGFRMVATILSDCTNLKSYCGWTDMEIKELMGRFGFKTIREVIDLYGKDSTYLNKVIVGNKYKPELLKNSLKK